jgi:hypothetical protein
MATECKRTVREVFHGHKLDMLKDMERRPLAPSVKASYTSARSKLGTYGDLINVDLINDEPEWLELNRPGSLIDPYMKSFSGCWEKLSNEEEMEEEDVVRVRLRPEFKEQVTEKYAELYRAVRRLANEEKANVKLVALPEALKIRVISKGPPFTYFVLKPLQKFLHRIMRNQRMFALIGSGDVTAEFLDEVFKGHDGLYHSLDYSSATDFLNPFLSNETAREICSEIGAPDDIRDLFLSALTGHLVEGLPQVWGQLMGSVISFIVLCIVNAAAIRKSYELLTKSESSLGGIPACVNGDDGAVKAPAEFLPIWKDVASLCGLEPSVGKVYTHESYLNINSTSFLEKEGRLTHVPYVNMGLVMGMTRSGGESHSTEDISDSVDRFGSLGARHHKLVESCPASLRLKAHELFIRKHWTLLKSVRLPWYVSESLGGVGLKPFREWQFKSDDVDDVSWHYYETDKGVRYGPSDQDQDCIEILNRGHFRSVSVRRLPTPQPIQVRNVWYTRKGFKIPRAKYGQPIVDLQISDSDIGFMDVATYYIAPSLVTQELSSRSRELLRANERAWAYLSKVTSQGFSLA